ncbi:MAG: two-component sensor histidine kinase [Polyangiaceae bacterium]|nr:two-component sensor histidine kinase [Polyangiaceae bacterium]
MRLGIRLQLLLALGALLVLAFVPLYFAVAQLTQASLRAARTDAAISLGKAVAGHVAEAAVHRAPVELPTLLQTQLGVGGVSAIGIYGANGELTHSVNESPGDSPLPRKISQGVERTLSMGRAAVLVLVPRERATVGVLVRTDSQPSLGAPLRRIVALYTGIFGLALLVFAYFAITRLVVRPVVELSSAARLVREGGRRFEVTGRGPAEIVDLSHSISQMTERLRVEEEQLRAKIAEVEKVARNLTEAQQSLIRSERLASVGRLAAGLAHEIGNPLSSILGFQDLLAMGGLSPEEERDFLHRMKRETERIHKVLRDLLDFARPASRSGAVKSGESELPSNVVDAIADAVALVRPQKDWKSIELVTKVDEAIPLAALSHERIVQVLLNLLLNAGDAVSPVNGRVAISASKKRIGEKENIELVVEDNGPGIPKEIEGHLFEPFATTKEVGKGTGLGLAVCRGLVEAAGGAIFVESGELGGARFVVQLPSSLPT